MVVNPNLDCVCVKSTENGTSIMGFSGIQGNVVEVKIILIRGEILEMNPPDEHLDAN